MIDKARQAYLDMEPSVRRFCEYYAGEADGRALMALKLAGLAKEGLHVNSHKMHAWRLLQRDDVKLVLESFAEADDAVAGRIERQRFVTKVMRGEIKEERVCGKDAIVVEVTASIADRLKAHDALAKSAGEGTKVDVTVLSAHMSDAELLAELAKITGGTDGQDAAGDVSASGDSVRSSDDV